MIALLLDAAMKIFGIHAATILGPSRASEVVDARWAVMFVLAERHN
ncbi:MAG: hypothetical protein GFH27_549323n10 [Chloroflexi bacterium AL-W]|nr:hypothetical protein [Chloroflexi bacterium AL-N1]NOK70161.1 hypothetical protein [Chloroflexi bacterium AL-N10]NOK77698.1 hypothetical protein [Chloroflexi bacterium AL-N5]NOK84707.1 hypothetical protein [Chloroflexi bacterium AL-W]NOK93230.1 hypothetical protein [Chloroflexi bacterium AL-N15]